MFFEKIKEAPLMGESVLKFYSGKLAQQADGSALCQAGETQVLATVCFEKFAEEKSFDFLPLTVDYREYTYAAGKIPGGWFKREGKPTEKEILTSRLIDRPIRPLFPDWYRKDTQITCLVISADGQNDPDILSINAASLAIALSPVPILETIGAVRVCFTGNNWLINPKNGERENCLLDLVVVGTLSNVVMVEGSAKQVQEQIFLEAIEIAHREIVKIINVINEIKEEKGKTKWEKKVEPLYTKEYYEEIKKIHSPELIKRLTIKEKKKRNEALTEYFQNLISQIEPEKEEEKTKLMAAFGELEKEIVRSLILNEGKRLDGRGFDDLREISCEIGILPRTHGSALFTRGETQALASVTLGTKQDAQIIEDFDGEMVQRFMLHYNFPPFSTGEVKALRAPSRREIGHGNLARRALEPVLPKEEDFPYTIRIVSDILSSNGSSSMATVCGGSLALMDAGVPVEAAVAGVAMGLVKEGDKNIILTDIAGQEDHYGDMDFKLAGTEKGITAIQMDIKIEGISMEILEKALQKAKEARLKILEIMNRAISSPRENLSPYAPRLYTIYIPKEKIGDVIGTGGKIIRSIIETTGCEIEIENDGKVIISSANEESARKAIELIQHYSAVPEIGKVYKGVVQRVEPYGVFVEILPGVDGLLHISEFTTFRIEDLKQLVKVGEEIEVKVIEID
ncbi:MAG: polyribonucleotide nucleotidyltransferase, partial [Thermoanaerobaculia bacterium]